ncbi:MAG: hypothetical protein HN390_10390 [Anaerolineae bacterium]|jgi:hypothetical protein|nr:hypothetical protein [Anaerolineae bacterium]MBT7189617.1 hypothetical protein [Anaerolineae bacterium]
MKPVFTRVIVAIGIPLAVFLILGALMMVLTGRNKLPEIDNSASIPLNFRVWGYNEADMMNFWEWLEVDGRDAERCFLLADLAFPFAYGAGLLTGLFLAWTWANRPFANGWLMAPVAITVIADWTENLIQLGQLSRFTESVPMQDAWIQVASTATSIKLIFFVMTLILIIVLCCRVRPQNQPGSAEATSSFM